MKLRHAVSALVGSTLIAAPVVAQAAPATARTSSPVEGEQLAGAGSFAWIIAVLVAAGVAAIIISDEDEEAPRSP